MKKFLTLVFILALVGFGNWADDTSIKSWESYLLVPQAMAAVSRDSFGLTSGDNTSQEVAEMRHFERFQMVSTSGTLVNIRVLIDDGDIAGDRIKAAIYSDQELDSEYYPYELIWGDNTGITCTDGWVTWSTTAENLTADEYYWLVYVLETGEGVRYQADQAVNSHRWTRSSDFVEDDWLLWYGDGGWVGSNNNQSVMHAVIEIGEPAVSRKYLRIRR